jgi:[protein-PII] uridylyltransferase
LDDPSTVQIVLAAIHDSTELLELLHCLTIADAAATGPAAWSDWKAGLVRQLVRRTRSVLVGEPVPGPAPLAPHLCELAAEGQTRVLIEGSDVIVIAPDGPGLLSQASGLLALHSLDVQSAEVRTTGGMAVNRFTVTPRFGEFPDAALLHGDLRRILGGTLPLSDKLRAKESAYEKALTPAAMPSEPRPAPRILWFDDEATDASVIEVRTQDGIGLLHWLTLALEDSGLDIRAARISSLGAYVVDAFYVTNSEGKSLSELQQADVTAEMTLALAR